MSAMGLFFASMRFALKTLWICVLISLAFVLILIALIFSFKGSSSEVASWVQAVGSIGAIVAAIFIPIWHANVVAKRRLINLLGIMRVLADEALEALWLLTNGMLHPEKESRQMVEYESFHRGREWAGLLNQLEQIPIAELSAKSAKDLSTLRDSVSFGAYVAGRIPQWLSRGGYSQPDVIEVLKTKRDLVSLVRARLPVPRGVASSEFVDAQKRGLPAEKRRPQPQPIVIDDAKFYRRYVWANDDATVPDSVYLQAVYPYGEKDIYPAFIEGPWDTFADAEVHVRGMTVRLHDEYMLQFLSNSL